MRRAGFLKTALVLFFAGMLCSCWGYAEVYYDYPYDYDFPDKDLIGTYRLTGFDIDYYDFYDPDRYLGSENEGDFSSFSGELRIGPDWVREEIFVEGQIYYYLEDYYYDIDYTDWPYEGILDLYYNYFGDYLYEDISFSRSGYYLTTRSYTCSQAIELCWEEWDYWRKVSDWP